MSAKIIADRKLLVNYLNKLLKCFKKPICNISVNENGAILQIAKDCTSFCNVILPYKTDKAVTVTIPADKFLDILEILQQDQVTIILDKDYVKVENTYISSINNILFELENNVPKKAKISLSRAMIDALLKSISKDNSRISLSNIFFDGRNIVTSDGHRLCLIEDLDTEPVEETLISKEAIMFMKQNKIYTTDVVILSEKESMIPFEYDYFFFTKSDNEFPAWERVYPNCGYMLFSISANKENIDTIKKLIKLVKRENSRKKYSFYPIINISAKNGNLFIKCANSDLDYTIEIDGYSECNFSNLFINAEYLYDALASFKTNKIKEINCYIQKDDPENKPLVFAPETTNTNYMISFLIMPCSGDYTKFSINKFPSEPHKFDTLMFVRNNKNQ